MRLGTGERLGPYEIRNPLGAGGMGEVYEARDTRLDRDVAIKITAAEFSDRFEREARAIAALNHPNICALYDVGPNYLVMERVPGQTLSDIIATARTSAAGRIDLADAVAIARQIAEALEAAHDRGIIHRDLKPSNVKITPDRVAKVLDFGLAKALDHGAIPDHDGSTFTSPARTETGMILGTARYMAPEQALGRSVDRRADIWAFGVVLFEMLTGQMLFRGDTPTEVIAAVIKDDIALDRLPPDVPPAIRQLLARCLERDPKQRLRDIGEARIMLADPASLRGGATALPQERSARSPFSWLAWIVGGLALTGAAAFAGWWLKPHVDMPLRRIELADPLASADGVALSPDGSRVAYFNNAHIYVRALDALAPQDLGPVHVTARLPFWSPDGSTIGFTIAGEINAIPATGGAIRQICRIPASRQLFDVAWRPDGTLLFAVARSGVYTVPAEGGTPTVYLEADPQTELDFASISPLSNDRLLVTARLRDAAAFKTMIVEPGAGHRRTTVIEDPDVTFVKADPRGLLMFRRRGSNNGVWAAPFDGTRVDLAKAVPMAPRGSSFQANLVGDVLITIPPGAPPTELVWMTERGEVSPPVSGARVAGIAAVALSPDQRHAAFVVDVEGDRHLVVRDLVTGSDVRLTPSGADAPTLDPVPSWFPSGDAVVFTTGGGPSRRVVARRLDGSGGERVLANGLGGRVTPNGRFLVYLIDDGGLRRLRYTPIAADGSIGAAQRIFQRDDPAIAGFELSPDGAVLAYTISEADSLLATFLTDFPEGTHHVQVTSRGGGRPRFARDGSALFFLAQAQPRTDPPHAALAKRSLSLKALATSGPEMQLMTDDEMPPGIVMPVYDVARDGRLLTIRRTDIGRPLIPRLLLVQNWRAAVAR